MRPACLAVAAFVFAPLSAISQPGGVENRNMELVGDKSKFYLLRPYGNF